MDYNNPVQSGRIAFLNCVDRDENPVDGRTHANAKSEWYRGWDDANSKECKGIEIGDGNFSGCDQSGGDCPTCGK
jgi:hypothetical protein